MGYIRDMFRTASEVALLTRQCTFLQSQLERETWKVEQLEQQIIKERVSKDKVLLRHADMMSEQAKMKPHFVKDAEPVVEPLPEVLSPQEEDHILWMAEQMRNADIDDGREPRALQVYADIIRTDPNKYILN